MVVASTPSTAYDDADLQAVPAYSLAPKRQIDASYPQTCKAMIKSRRVQFMTLGLSSRISRQGDSVYCSIRDTGDDKCFVLISLMIWMSFLHCRNKGGTMEREAVFGYFHLAKQGKRPAKVSKGTTRKTEEKWPCFLNHRMWSTRTRPKKALQHSNFIKSFPKLRSNLRVDAFVISVTIQSWVS
jgi:hypothetical protein